MIHKTASNIIIPPASIRVKNVSIILTMTSIYMSTSFFPGSYYSSQNSNAIPPMPTNIYTINSVLINKLMVWGGINSFTIT